MDDAAASFYLESAPASDYVDTSQSFDSSLPASRSAQPAQLAWTEQMFGLPQECDFLTLITAISAAYSSGQYMSMVSLNDVPLADIAEGRDFQVSRLSLLKMASREPNPGPNAHGDGNTYSKFIVKNVKNVKGGAIMRPKDMALFVRELSILHHFRHHDGIVQLLGVGWSYDCLEDVDLTPCPKPALLLEEAQGTLERLLAQSLNMNLLVEMKICSDIASGLLALHECGLVHGDVKPANVLVFPQPVIREGVEDPSYRCKISDFSLTRVVGAQDSWFSGGTRLYIAPEQGSKLSPEQLLRTDVWSLGLLFAQVTQRELDLKQAIGKPELMEKIIHQSVHDSIESSTWDSVTTTLRLSIFKDTVQKDANKRHLHRVVDNLQMYFQLKAQHLAIRSIRTQTSRFEPIKQNDLLLSYENFKYISGHVHDTIVARLQEVAQSEQDPRQPQALFELAVIALSDYAGPLFTPQEGLAMLRKSAELGYVRAQGWFTRVQKVLEPHREVSPQAQGWLENAALLNHTVAREYVRLLHNPRAMTSASSSTAVPIVEEHSPEHLNARDADGNTPLILASRDGDHSAIVRLLDAGANPAITNDTDENLLHFAWCFSEAEVVNIVSKLKQCVQLFSQEAKGVKMDPSLELYPLPPGTPLERAVAMNNLPAVQVLLDGGKYAFPINGRQMRRALLLAFRLHLADIQQVLVHFTEEQKGLWDTRLPPLRRTFWEYKGERRNFLEAVLVGGVSGFGMGADVPLKWWRLCQLGKHRSADLNRSIEVVLSLEDCDESREALLDASKTLVFKERFHDSLLALLEWKARMTRGNAQRVLSLKHLTWKSEEASDTRVRQIYRIILRCLALGHFRGEDRLRLARSFYRYRPSRTEIFMKAISSDVDYQSVLEPWQTMPSVSRDGILERPVETINYVDQIFYDNERGTLLHQAIHIGDRAIFDVLVCSFGANLALPAPGNDSGVVRQWNVYALLAHTTHCDLWFAKRFRTLNIPFSLPLDLTSGTHNSYFPPLYDALQRCRLPYALWMLRHGASLDEQLESGWDVLSVCLTPNLLDPKLLEFLFPQSGRSGGSDYLPTKLEGGDGFEVFKFMYECQQLKTKTWLIQRLVDRIWPPPGDSTWPPLINYKLYLDEWSDEAPAECSSVTIKLKRCWSYLFDLYPHVPNSRTYTTQISVPVPWFTLDRQPTLRPRLRWLTKDIPYPFRPPSIFEQSLGMSDDGFTLFRLAMARFEERAKLRPHRDAFPTQTWIDMLYGSPLDLMSLGSCKKNPLYIKYGYWPSIRHWLPSLLLHRFFVAVAPLGFAIALPFTFYVYVFPSMFVVTDIYKLYPNGGILFMIASLFIDSLTIFSLTELQFEIIDVLYLMILIVLFTGTIPMVYFTWSDDE